MNTVTLEKIALRFAQRFDANGNPFMHWDNQACGAQARLDDFADQMTIEVNGFLLGEYPDPVYISYPSTWWEHLKARWFPAWAIRKWPVIERTHRIEFTVMYPDFKPKIARDRSRKVVSFKTNDFTNFGTRAPHQERGTIDDGPYFHPYGGSLDERRDVINDGPWTKPTPGGKPPPELPNTPEELREWIHTARNLFLMETNKVPTKLHLGRRQRAQFEQMTMGEMGHYGTTRNDAEWRQEFAGLAIVAEPVTDHLEVRK